MYPDKPSQWVLDGSALINLAAMPDPGLLIRALSVPCIAPRKAANEVTRIRRPDRATVNPGEYVRRLVEVVELSEIEWQLFEGFVGGDDANDLDDGEAAVLSVAICRGGSCILDDGKPIRTAACRIPPVATRSTVGILKVLWDARLVERDLIQASIVDALQYARMRVQVEHLEWVLGLVPDNARVGLPSLPRRARVAVGPIGSRPRS